MVAGMHITLDCSPDADDLFMVRALLEGLIPMGDYTFAIDTAPTDALNRKGGADGPDVLAISAAHYPQVKEHYLFLPHGGSMGEGYGPVVIGPEPVSLEALAGKRVAVPGLTTTAYCVLRMIALERGIDLEPVVVPITPYARIFDALRSGEVDAGLIIHEGRLTYEDEGFAKIIDIGEWWQDATGLPLPLGGNCIKKSLGEPAITEVSALLRQGIAHGLQHKDEAVRWLLARNGPLATPERISRYLDMYANQRTLDYGPEGRAGVEAFFARASAAGLLPPTTVEWSA